VGGRVLYRASPACHSSLTYDNIAQLLFLVLWNPPGAASRAPTCAEASACVCSLLAGGGVWSGAGQPGPGFSPDCPGWRQGTTPSPNTHTHQPSHSLSDLNCTLSTAPRKEMHRRSLSLGQSVPPAPEGGISPISGSPLGGLGCAAARPSPHTAPTQLTP
jgi:hypothetical protein